MTKFALKYALCFLLLLPAQAIVFDRLMLFNVAIPLVFLYLIVMLPVTLGTNTSTLLGFLCGFVLDIFCDTPGVNALCCTVLAFARKPLFHLYVSTDDDLAGRSPSTATMGAAAYLKFMLTMVLVYCTMMFAVEAFQFFNFRLLLIRIVASTLYTFLMLWALDSVLRRTGVERA